MILHGLPFAEYAAIPAVNSTAIRWGMHTSQHMRAYMDGLIEQESEDLAFGRAVHARLMEPDRYREEYNVATKCQHFKGNDQCGNRGKLYNAERGEWFCGIRGHAPDGSEEPDDFISIEQAADIEAIAQSLHDADCMHQLAAPGWSEATVTFDMLGVPCKARLDRVTEDLGAVIDVKKVQRGKADDESCKRSIATYNYHVQAAFYCQAVALHSGRVPEFYWVFVEDKAPYCVNVILADFETLGIGLVECQKTLERWKRDTRTNRYIGHTTGGRYFTPRGLPGWKREQYAGDRLPDFEIAVRCDSGQAGPGLDSGTRDATT